MIIRNLLNNYHVKVICLVIALILVFFTRSNSLEEEPVVVFLETKTNYNYTFSEPLPTRVTLTLKGEEEEIKKVLIDDLTAYVDISEIKEDGVYTLPVLINQNKVFGKTERVEITVDPPVIKTRIEERITKYLRVESVITGIPAHGYELDSSFVNPAFVSVSGPRSHIEDLSSIKTEPVDVTSKVSDFIERVRLNREDELLSFPEGSYVECRGIISERKTFKTLNNVNIQVKGLRDGLAISNKLPLVTVNVEGSMLSLEEFTKNNIALTINLEKIKKPGTYEIPVYHWSPKFARIYEKSVNSVTVVIRRSPKGSR